MAFPARAWGSEYLEDTSHRAVVLEHYDREQLSIRRYLLFLGLDPETCREIVQDTFLKLHEHLLADGDRTNLRAWLYRVAHNLARNSQASSHASRTEPLIDRPELRQTIEGEIRRALGMDGSKKSAEFELTTVA